MQFTFNNGKKIITGRKTLIMAILNITPDSFSDGGKWNNIDSAKRCVEEFISAGADIIDIGAESTRPNFIPISADEEISRLKPILKAIVKDCPTPISIDTYKAKTAEAAINLGADMINDIYGLQYEMEPLSMAKVIAKYNCPLIAMHNQKIHGDVIDSITQYFRKTFNIAGEVGINRNNIIIDPGIGFNKTQEENLEILRRLDELNKIDEIKYPLLLGVSRKSVIHYVTKLPVDKRDEVTGAICAIGITKGVDIVRVHNVNMISAICKMADAIVK